MYGPIFLKLTDLSGGPVWVNMNWVWKMYRIDKFTRLYILNTETKQLVEETPEEIEKMVRPRIIISSDGDIDGDDYPRIVGYDEYMKALKNFGTAGDDQK